MSKTLPARKTLAARIADLRLPDTDGREIRLGSLWEESPAVVAFLRHYGWIFCREHVAQLRDQEPQFREAGARLAAVGLGDARYGRAFRQETGIGFPLLVDEKRRAYRALELKEAPMLHLLRRDNAAARRRARRAGHRQHRLGKNPFQLGGSFVFGPGDVDLLVHVSETFGDNAAPADLLAALR